MKKNVKSQVGLPIEDMETSLQQSEQSVTRKQEESKVDDTPHNDQIGAQGPLVEEDDSGFDLDSIRLTQHFGGQIGVKKLLTTVPLRKPNRTQFFRTHPDYRMDVMLLRHDETNELYVVMPKLLDLVLQLAEPYRLILVVDPLGTAFIWPLKIPDERSPNNWHKSALDADTKAQRMWIRIKADMSLGAYQVYEAAGELPEPEWPPESWKKHIEVAFKGKIIDSPDHVVIQKIHGLL